MGTSAVPVIEGWFTTTAQPALLGTRCEACGSAFFPRETTFCRNPGCSSDALVEVELPRRGRIWSYTDARYQPPPPYIPRTDPYEPFALAAVELDGEGMVVLGQVADGFGLEDLTIGGPVELVVEPLYRDGDTTYLTWKRRPRSEEVAR
jgi:uncharacterized OB-fold protein